jgi:cytochrome c5
MSKLHKHLLLAAGALMLALGIGACAASMQASAAPGLVSGLDPAAPPLVQHGHQVYITDCASCHRARIPQNYSKERWAIVLPRMEKRAKLSEDDAKAVEAYINASLNCASAPTAQ